MRYASRTDSNQSEIVSELRQLGFSVRLLFRTGRDEPDLLVGYRGSDRQVEVKTSDGKLSAGQGRYIDAWRGARIIVAQRVEDIMGEW